MVWIFNNKKDNLTTEATTALGESNEDFDLINDFDRRLYSRRSRRYVRQFKPSESLKSLTSNSTLNKLLGLNTTQNLVLGNKLNSSKQNKMADDLVGCAAHKFNSSLFDTSSSVEWNDNFFLCSGSDKRNSLNG